MMGHNICFYREICLLSWGLGNAGLKYRVVPVVPWFCRASVFPPDIAKEVVD